MPVIIIDVDRSALRGACRLFGGIRSVARMAGVNNGNLGRWLKGEKALSNEGALKVLDTVGLPLGQRGSDIVHEWILGRQPSDLQRAMGLYFPDGAEIACAPWSRWRVGDLLKKLTLASLGNGTRPKEIYVLTDGVVRAVLRKPHGLLVSLDEFGEGFSWKGGSVEEAVLDIDPSDKRWLGRGVTTDLFDQAWQSNFLGWSDVIEFGERHGVTPRMALDWMKETAKDQQSNRAELEEWY